MLLHHFGVALLKFREAGLASRDMTKRVKDRWIGNLPPVEMEDGEHDTIGDGIEKLVRVPRGSERGGFSFAIADDAGNNEIGIVEGDTIRMQQRVAEFAAFIDGPGDIGRIV